MLIVAFVPDGAAVARGALLPAGVAAGVEDGDWLQAASRVATPLAAKVPRKPRRLNRAVIIPLLSPPGDRVARSGRAASGDGYSWATSAPRSGCASGTCHRSRIIATPSRSKRSRLYVVGRIHRTEPMLVYPGNECQYPRLHLRKARVQRRTRPAIDRTPEDGGFTPSPDGTRPTAPERSRAIRARSGRRDPYARSDSGCETRSPPADSPDSARRPPG